MWRALHVDDFKGGRVDGGADAEFAEQFSLVVVGLMSRGAGNADDRHRLGFARNYGELCNQDERDSVNVTADIRSKLVGSIVLFTPPVIRDFSQLESCVPR